MKISKSNIEPGTPPRKSGEFIIGESSLFFQAIENADGVPFHLIFGEHPGDGYYSIVGKGIKDLLGIASEDFTEKLFQGMIEEIVPLTDGLPGDASESRRKFINGEIKQYRADILVRTAGGEKKWIHDASIPLISTETGKVMGAFGILSEITGGRTKAGPARLEAAFLSNISHEIRTPLNAIVGFSTLLSERNDTAELRKEYLNIILRSSDQLLEIIDELVEISKIEAKKITVKREKVNLNSVILRVNDQFVTEAAGKGLFLGYSIPADEKVPEIITDEFKVTQALRNLVSNALKFTGAGRVEFGYTLREGSAEFYVSDTGKGIPLEHKDHVFDRFYQSDHTSTREYGGLGLGLAISKAYVELLGGEIWFTSTPDKGSLFLFTVPGEKTNGDKSSNNNNERPSTRKIIV
jgi:signal transduction histidine kinase